MTFTKEQLIARAETVLSNARTAADFHDSKPYHLMDVHLAEIALASLEAESKPRQPELSHVIYHFRDWNEGFPIERFKADYVISWMLANYPPAQPAAVSVPDDIDTRMKAAGMLSAAEIIAGQPIDAFMKHAGVINLESLLKWAEMRRAEFLRMQAKYELGDNPKDDMYEWVISHVAAFSELHVNIRAAMLQSAEPVSQHPELTVWYGSMPETNGKANWTAILHRKGECLSTGITIEISEYPDRVRYEADRMRHIIGELKEEPDILAYDAHAHSGYVKPGNSPVIPDGCCIMPKKLTAENGAKGAFSGEFSETKFINCPECFGDDECETCDGSGRIEISVPVSWTTIKEIWAKGVEHFAAAPQQEVKGV